MRERSLMWQMLVGVPVSVKMPPWMPAEIAGMGAEPPVKAQEWSLIKHPRTIDGECRAAEALVTGKLSWQEGDFCKQR